MAEKVDTEQAGGLEDHEFSHAEKHLVTEAQTWNERKKRET